MSKKSFQLIDGSMTMHGIRFLMSGGRMERFESNPVMLYMHTRGNVIGSWANLRLDSDAYVADPIFDDEDPAVKEIARKVEKKFLRACSMGVIIHKLEMVNGEPTAIEWEPYECSIVDVGSNANALVLYTPEGEMVEDTENHVKNLTLSIMSETKKPVSGTEGALATKEIALAAGLAEDATADSIVQKITEVTNNYLEQVQKVKDLELAAKTKETAAIKEMLDLAIDSKKISATERPHYETLAATNFDSVKAILSKISAPVDLVGVANQGKSQATESKEDLFEEYEKLDKSGKLEKLQATDPAKFKTLYFARWEKEFKA